MALPVVPAIFANIPAAGGIAAPDVATIHFSPSFLVMCERNGWPKDKSAAEISAMVHYLNAACPNPLPACLVNMVPPGGAGAAAAAAAAGGGVAGAAGVVDPTTLPLAAAPAFGGMHIQERDAAGNIANIPNPIGGARYVGPAQAAHNLPVEVRQFYGDYHVTQACAMAAISLVGCMQVKELKSRNFRSFRTIFNIDAPNDMLIAVAKCYKNRFPLLAGDPNFANVRAMSAFILYHTKAFSSAGIIAKAFEGLFAIGIATPIRALAGAVVPAWYAGLPVAIGAGGPDAITYYRAIDAHSQSIGNQEFVQERDVVLAVAVNAAFGQPIDDWKHGEKVMNNTPMARYNIIRDAVRTALADFNAARIAAAGAAGGAAAAAVVAFVA